MASIFISHSSVDKSVAKQLAGDLKHCGHKVWLDEWQIRVGQCIPTEIEHGLTKADFVLLLLSTQAVKSNWVDREWKVAYWDEVNRDSVVILPVLLEKCEIPKLIQTKKYANISENYAAGFHELLSAIDWYSEAKGLTTSYEKSALVLPTIIRNSKELIVLSLLQLTAKVNRMIDKNIAVKDARVSTVFGAEGSLVEFSLVDKSGVYIKCCVEQGTALEDVILEKPQGDFYGTIKTSGRFLISEWEPTKQISRSGSIVKPLPVAE